MSADAETTRLFQHVPSSGGAEIAANVEERRHIAGLLTSVEREALVSQRKLAAELGVALGLVNAYIKRCVRKGLIKVQQVPSRRYAYFLTPQGFAEKSRLTAEYLSWSLTFFRQARADCVSVFEAARRRGWREVGLVGGGELAEIAIISASEQGLAVVAIVAAEPGRGSFLGVPIFAALDQVEPRPDGWVITAINDAQGAYDAVVAAEGAARALAPVLLSIRLADSVKTP